MTEADADFSIDKLDEAVHGRVRLGILTHLANVGKSDFTALKRHLGVTDGNLGAHVAKLESVKYVKVAKAFVQRRPVTSISLTPAGRAALVEYLNTLSQLIESMRSLKG